MGIRYLAPHLGESLDQHVMAFHVVIVAGEGHQRLVRQIERAASLTLVPSLQLRVVDQIRDDLDPLPVIAKVAKLPLLVLAAHDVAGGPARRHAGDQAVVDRDARCVERRRGTQSGGGGRYVRKVRFIAHNRRDSGDQADRIGDARERGRREVEMQ